MAKPERCDNCQENPPTHALSDLSDGETGYLCIPCLVGTAGALGEAWMAILIEAGMAQAPPAPADDMPEPKSEVAPEEEAPPARKRG